MELWDIHAYNSFSFNTSPMECFTWIDSTQVPGEI